MYRLVNVVLSLYKQLIHASTNHLLTVSILRLIHYLMVWLDLYSKRYDKTQKNINKSLIQINKCFIMVWVEVRLSIIDLILIWRQFVSNQNMIINCWYILILHQLILIYEPLSCSFTDIKLQLFPSVSRFCSKLCSWILECYRASNL